MNELIWFSIPGAIALSAFYLVFPRIGAAPGVVLVSAAPILGFIIHQTYRTFFEWLRGWESPHRPVLKLIQTAYGISHSQRHTAFLIWESTFYSGKIPAAFIDHNRNAWHYVMSFRSACFASGLSTAMLVCSSMLKCTKHPPIIYIFLFLCVALMFWWKGHLTYSSLVRQEVEAFQIYRKEFNSVHECVRLI